MFSFYVYLIFLYLIIIFLIWGGFWIRGNPWVLSFVNRFQQSRRTAAAAEAWKDFWSDPEMDCVGEDSFKSGREFPDWWYSQEVERTFWGSFEPWGRASQEEAGLEDSGESLSISLSEDKKFWSGEVLVKDEIRSEILKALDVGSQSQLTHLYNITWDSGTLHLSWRRNIFGVFTIPMPNRCF